MVRIEVKRIGFEEANVDVVILPVFQDGSFPPAIQSFDKKAKGLISSEIKSNKFEGEKGKLLCVSSSLTQAKKIYVLGVGKKSELDRTSLREAYASAAQELGATKYERVAIAYIAEKSFEKDFDAILEGFLLGSYRFNKYKQKPERPFSIKEVLIAAPNATAVGKATKAYARALVMAGATCFARDLINEPANIVNPEYMEKQAVKIAKETGLKIKVLQEDELKKNGMNLIIAVGTGSAVRPRMVHLEYKPKAKSKRVVALVGKGVCFDSGGLSLKSQDNMYGMKADMSGSAAVLAAMWAISKLKLPIHVHGIFPLVENLPSSTAIKPGDVFISYNGKSVEIENTDAEGRLILADALTYAGKQGATEIIDAATLTGAVVVALGEDVAGTFSNNKGLVKRIHAAADLAGEKFWEMPIESAYKRMLKSDVADMKNVGARWGGAITAAIFLQEFIPERTPWAHLDIAGPAFVGHDQPTCIKGGTGFVVRTFIEFVAN